MSNGPLGLVVRALEGNLRSTSSHGGRYRERGVRLEKQLEVMCSNGSIDRGKEIYYILRTSPSIDLITEFHLLSMYSVSK